MRATTIKLQGELLEEIEAVKPPEQSVSAYVRSVLRKGIERERARKAAYRYRDFLKEHQEEAKWLAEWARADLATPVEGESSS